MILAQVLPPGISDWPSSLQLAFAVGVGIAFMVITLIGRRTKFSLSPNNEDEGREIRKLKAQLREREFKEELQKVIEEKMKEYEADTDHQYAELEVRISQLKDRVHSLELSAAAWGIDPQRVPRLPKKP